MFQEDNASWEKDVKMLLKQKQIMSTAWPAHDLLKNLWGKLKEMVKNKPPSSKADLRTAVRDSLSQTDVFIEVHSWAPHLRDLKLFSKSEVVQRFLYDSIFYFPLFDLEKQLWLTTTIKFLSYLLCCNAKMLNHIGGGEVWAGFTSQLRKV